MNLFDLYASISLDDSGYTSGISRAVKNGKQILGSLKTITTGTSRAGIALERVGSILDETGNGFEQASESADDVADAINDIGGNAGDAAPEIGKMSEGVKRSDLLFANLASQGIGAAISAVKNFVSALVNLDESTREFRDEQGRLSTAFHAVGFDSDTARQAFQSLYGVLGDTGQATEASQLLARLANNEEDVSRWATIAAGVVGTFGDSLPIESLIEASNETANVGKVTGALADALNWVGISEDDFNAKLSELTTTQERSALITRTLNGVYSESAEAFIKNNQSVIKSNENHLKLKETMAKVGESVENVKNMFIEKFGPAIEEVGGKVTDFIDGIDFESISTAVMSVINALIENGPLIVSIVAGIAAGFVAWNIVTVVQSAVGAIQAFSAVVTGAATAQTGLNAAIMANPIGAIITLVVALVTSLVTLWATSEDFRDGVIEIFENIKSGFESVVQFFKDRIEDIKQGFSGLVSGIKSLLGIHSPSRVFAAIGENMALGVGAGWENEFGKIKDKIDKSMNFGTATMDLGVDTIDIGTSGLAKYSGLASTILPASSFSGPAEFVVNLTNEIDGAVLSQKMYRYNLEEQALQGTSLVEG